MTHESLRIIRRLHTASKTLGWTEYEFSERAGLVSSHFSTLKRRITHHGQTLAVETMFALVNVLKKNGYSPVWLVFGSGKAKE